ncbi:MAG: ABC transporter ATP-binding protein [Myxococcota bacterium]|nr:ABC transporter ATP-binding protein [Myxococcota bacterium]
MKLVLEFARAHPRRTLLTLICLVAAGLAEGLGLSTALPVLEIVADPTAAEGGEESALAAGVRSVLGSVGLEPTVGVLLTLIMTGISLKAALVLLANRQVGYTVARIATDLRLDLVRALLGARWAYYTGQPVGSVANAFATEAERASQAFLHGVLLVTALFQVAVYFCVALAVSWQGAIAAIGVGALTSVALMRFTWAARRAGARQTDLLKTSLARLSDTLHGVKPLRAMAREELMGPLLERETLRLDRAIRGEVLSKEGLKAMQEPILVASLSVGLYLALTQFGVPLASLLMICLLFVRTLTAVGRAQKEYQALGAREAAYHSLRETIARAEAHSEGTAGGVLPRLERAIHLKGVALAYGDTPVLQQVDLTVRAGEITTLIGPSGAGKTSIADLVIGLVGPSAGEVRIDDVPLDEVDLHAWRRLIGYVPQELFLLHDTIAVNVTLGDPDLDDDDVWRALRQAGADAFVRSLPDGIHTAVGERGSLLSGGQRQRIAIARALVHKPSLLILDEATTALDPATELAVCETVGALRGDITILAISHQRALVELADRVYRIENGVAKPE